MIERIITVLVSFAVFAILVLLLVTRTILAEPINGQDYLAIQHKRFKAHIAAQHLVPGEATGNLDWTFGESLEPVEKLLKTSPKYHRVHFINGACIRGGNCGKYEPGYGYGINSWDKAVRKKNPKILAHLQSRARLYRDLCARYPNTDCLASPELEHNLSREAFRVLADNILLVWPQVQLVNSPVGGIPIERYKGAWIERHGTRPQSDADIVSTDGVEASDMDSVAFMKRTNTSRMKIRFVWSRVYNCRSNGPFIDPRKRNSCPTAGNLQELAHLLDDRGQPPKDAVPSGCKGVRPFKAPWLLKPMAEDTGSSDIRANKPVILMAPKSKKLLVIASNGEEIGFLPIFPDSNPHQLERYYSGLGSNVNGYQFELRAKAKTGSPYTWLKIKSTCYGPVVFGRRNNVYRD